LYPSFNARALGVDADADRTIALAALAGFAGVDLLVRDLVDRGDDVAGLRQKIHDHNMRPGAWPLPVHWRGDEDRFQADLLALPRYAAAAAELGLARTATWVMPETPGRPSSIQSQHAHLAEVAELHLIRLTKIARILHANGTCLGLEVIGVASSRTGRGLPFVCRIEDVWPYVDVIREHAPSAGILLDAFHLYAAGEDVSKALARGASSVVWVHVADLPAGAPPDRGLIRDEVRGLPGENGAVDARGLLKRLADVHYDGPVTVETLAGCRSLAGLDDVAIARRAAESLQKIWPAATRTSFTG
jgi:sugar phosphate isomerase/epimerase